MSSDDLIDMALAQASVEQIDETQQEEFEDWHISENVDDESAEYEEKQQPDQYPSEYDDLDANRFVAQCNGTITDQTIPVIQEVFSQIPAEKLPTLEEMERRLFAMVDVPGYRDTLAQHLFINNQGKIPLEFLRQQIYSLTAEEIVASATNLYRIGVSSQGSK